MEGKFGEPKTPEIKKEELLRVIDEVEWETGYMFEYNDTGYLLLLVAPEELSPEDPGAEFHRSTLVGGFDIYILETLQGEKRKRKLFHEILEANLQDKGMDSHEAHDIALREEIKQFGPRK